MHEPSLPPGVTIDQAGRAYAWRWLQGHRNHLLRLKREAPPAHKYAKSKRCVSAFIAALCPWQVHECPGYRVLLMRITGQSHPGVNHWLYRGSTPRKPALRRMLTVCEAKLEEWQAAREAIEAELAKPSHRPRQDKGTRGG
jgi:hypothetical protein